jgi:chitin disaccharide deacetylase
VNSRRVVIINADDFGRTGAVNRGIRRAYERGIVTSASLMVRQPGANDAAQYARAHPELSVGLHLDLYEWAYGADGWSPVYELPAKTPEEITTEIRSQVERFRELLGTNPTHLDSHQNAHRHEPVRSTAIELARELGVPLRGCDLRIRHCGLFYGQASNGQPFPEHISVRALINLLRALAPGVTELSCHPGEIDDLESPYLEERRVEVNTLCDPLVRRTLEEESIELGAFGAERRSA